VVADTAVTSSPHGLAVTIGLLLAILGHEVVRRRRQPHQESELVPMTGDGDAAALIAERLLLYCPEASASAETYDDLEEDRRQS
jgi:hypothetical protein